MFEKWQWQSTFASTEFSPQWVETKSGSGLGTRLYMRLRLKPKRIANAFHGKREVPPRPMNATLRMYSGEWQWYWKVFLELGAKENGFEPQAYTSIVILYKVCQCDTDRWAIRSSLQIQCVTAPHVVCTQYGIWRINRKCSILPIRLQDSVVPGAAPPNFPLLAGLDYG